MLWLQEADAVCMCHREDLECPLHDPLWFVWFHGIAMGYRRRKPDYQTRGATKTLRECKWVANQKRQAEMWSGR